MKISKRAEQHNVELNMNYYSVYELKTMLANKEIFYFDEYLVSLEPQYELGYYVNIDKIIFRIYLEDGDELKVVLDEYGTYTNVLIKNGQKYFVKL